MDEVRSAFTIVSLLTFVGIIAWAWSPLVRARGDVAVADLMRDDDRCVPSAPHQERDHG